jgi:HlyD family secretion protein
MRLRLALALSGVLAATAAAGWWYATQRPIPVAVADVAEDVPVTVFGLGVIEARVLSRVGFEVPGRLVAVLADHGDRVSAGAALARLDVESQEARVAKAEAAVLSADAAAARIEAQRARSEAMLAQRQSTARRRRELAARGAGSTEAAELADTEARAAQADLAVSRADVQLARAAQAEALASLQTERTALARHTLTAPFDALVVARSREPGAALTPGEAVFTLIAPDSIWGLAYVDEGHAGDLAVGPPW